MAETEEPTVELNISPEKVCYIIAKAREFDATLSPADADAEPSPSDASAPGVSADESGDPTLAELSTAINGLNDDEVVDLIALAWVGRGDFGVADWEDARALARERHRHHSARYLMGIPTLGDGLEEGLAQLGHSCADEATDRL